MAPQHNPVFTLESNMPLEHQDQRLASETDMLLFKMQRQPWSLSTKVAGLLVLGGLIWSWVLQAEAAQALQVAMQSSKPFFIVCYNHTSTAVLLPLLLIYDKCFQNPDQRANGFDVVSVLQRYTVIPLDKLFGIALTLSAYYCVVDYFWYAALANVSVAVGTAIFNCSPLFVYCFSICFLHESLTMMKVLGVLTSFIGVTMIVIFQNQDSMDLSDLTSVDSAGLVAALLVLISAALYAGYEVRIRIAVGDELTDTSTLLMLAGLSGILTIPFWIVGSFVFAALPFPSLYEPLGFSTTGDALLFLLATGASSVIFNICLPLSLCWTSPLETSVGCMLTIPLSGLFDMVVHHTSFSWECVIGSLLVMTGFAILEYGSPSHPSNVVPKRPETIV